MAPQCTVNRRFVLLRKRNGILKNGFQIRDQREKLHTLAKNCAILRQKISIFTLLEYGQGPQKRVTPPSWNGIIFLHEILRKRLA